MSELNLSLDAAYMKWWSWFFHDMHTEQGGNSKFSKSDGSEQGGREWLMTNSSICLNSNLEGVAKAQDELVRIKEAVVFERRQHTDEEIEEIKHHMDFLDQSVIFHTSPPAGLGAKMMNLGCKVHAYEHSSLLESCGLEGLKINNDSTISLTGDFGTESGIPDVQVSVEQLFPWSLN
jgi:hypothetical protein